jgi:O-antigen ligase
MCPLVNRLAKKDFGQEGFWNHVARQTKFFKAEAVPFWALITFLILTLFTGGGSRADIQSLVILRPAAVIFCGIGLWSLRWEHVKAYRFLFGMASAIFALVLLHLLPLPPAAWEALPGRGLLTQIEDAAGLGAVWRPISMVPSATWNAFFSLFVPLAVLVLGAQLSRGELFKLLPWLLGFGLLSGFWGIMQIIGPSDSPLYLYAGTGNGSANGLFANRNHQAVLLACLFPMLAVYAATRVQSEEQSGVKLWASIGIGVVLVPLILLTGSRAGFLLALLGLLLIPFLYRRPTSLTPKKRTHRKFDLRYGIGAMVVLGLGALSVIMSRGEAFQRLIDKDQIRDERFKVWGPIVEMAWQYFPFGSGIGSFVETYQIDEPSALLSPEYYNHAHMDWLETYLVAGLPGLLLVAVSVAAYLRQSLKAFRKPLGAGRGPSFARLGVVLLGFFGLASVVDYPLRVPILSCFFVVGLLWLATGSAVGDNRG